MDIEDKITRHLAERGADLIGFADLSTLPTQVRADFPRAVSFAVALPPGIVGAITEGPTKAYHAAYGQTNALLGHLSHSLEDFLRGLGFAAVSSAVTHKAIDPDTCSTVLPHKTVATLAGLGWIGKCALLVNERFGSAIRLNRVLTDAPFRTGTAVTEPRCGDCRRCVDACPGQAITGDEWAPARHRDTFFDAFACRRAAREIAQRKTGISGSFCGICIAVCPWTQAYIKQQ